MKQKNPAYSTTYSEVCWYQCWEDLHHGVVVERVHANHVEVAQEARSHVVAATTGRTHGRQELHVLQDNLWRVLQVIPDRKHKPGLVSSDNRWQVWSIYSL